MLNLFGLGRQHDALFGAVQQLEPHKKTLAGSRLFDCRAQLRKTDDALKSFNYTTKTIFSRFRSFLPFTRAFSLRVNCAIELENSRAMIAKLASVQEYIKEEKPDKVKIVSDELFDPRRPSPRLPVHYHSVIGVGRNHFQELRHRQRSRSPSPEPELKKKNVANNKHYGHYA